MRVGHWVRYLLTGAAVIAVLFGAETVFGEDVSRWTVRIAALVGGAIVAGIVWVFFPPPFDITVRKRDMDYEFGREDVATAFAEANGTTVDARYEDDD